MLYVTDMDWPQSNTINTTPWQNSNQALEFTVT